jgi:hypothetical protein
MYNNNEKEFEVSNLNLVELSEQLTVADIEELFARVICLQNQKFLHSVINNPDTKPEYVAIYTELLSVPIRFAADVNITLNEKYFRYTNFQNHVETIVSNIAEEYVRS